MSWMKRALRTNEAIEAVGLRRSIRDFDARGLEGRIEGRDVVSFASNDYLGLTSHPRVIAAAHDALERWGSGAGSARLIAGSRPIHGELERGLADWKDAEAALLFPNGYAANLSVLTTFASDQTRIFSDAMNHASIVDGCRLARGEVVVYPHLDLAFLERGLKRASRNIVVTDAVFSMDGDIAPLQRLAQLCARYDALLIVDEAHAVLQEHIDFGEAEVLRVGTLSKFLASMGGFVTGARPFIDNLVNKARPFIFTTALTPADAAAALEALCILRSAEGGRRTDRLWQLVQRIAPGHPSPIVPVVLGDERAALEASRQLLERGLFVPAIRPPSVPPGTARLRVALSAAHTDAQVEMLTVALKELSPVMSHA